MYRLFVGGFIAVAFLSCTKDAEDEEAIFYGMWVKGVNRYDTIQFLHKNGKNMMSHYFYNSLTSTRPTELSYIYRDGKLYINLFPTLSDSPKHITSFRWNRIGQEFTLRGIEVTGLLSSAQTEYTFRKL